MEFFQLLRVHGVQTLAARDIFANQSIDFGWRSTVRQPRMNNHRLGARLRRKVAFVAHANDFTIQAQGKKNLRGRRQQRNNSHASNLSHPQYSVRTTVSRSSLRSSLFAARSGTGLLLFHLANNLSRCVSLSLIVGILPDIVKDVPLPNLDNLSAMQIRDFVGLILKSPSDEVPFPESDLDPHPLVTTVRCFEWRLDQNEFARL